jgi:hypothetical protein
MKKLVAIALVMILALSLALAACEFSIGGDSNDKKNDDKDNNTPSGNGGDGYKVPDGVDYVETGHWPIVWPNSGIAANVPSFEGVTKDNPWSTETSATITACNVPRSQFIEYTDKLKADGFAFRNRYSDAMTDGHAIIFHQKDDIEVRIDFDPEYNSIYITIKIEKLSGDEQWEVVDENY